MAETAPTLDEILEPGFLDTLFQPVLRVGHEKTELHSVEALARGPRGSLFESASLLCDFARRKRAEPAVDRACIRAALRKARRLPRELPLSLNVHAATLHRDPEFAHFLRETSQANGVAASRLTVEILEHAPNWADQHLAEALSGLRGLGVRIALDDIGLGQSSFRMILDIRPDEFKVDRHFVNGCSADPYRRAILAGIAELSARFGAQLVAEGVDSPADLAAARDLGIELFQGYLFFPALDACEIRSGNEGVGVGLGARLMARP